jgi:hypothetical protein
MYTCKVCNYALTIGKLTSNNQDNIISLSEPNDFIKMFTNKRRKVDNNSLDMTIELTFDINSLNAQIQKNGIKSDTANTIVQKYNNIKKNMVPNTFCLKCAQCNETFILPAGKLLSIKLKKTNNVNNIDNIDEIISDYTLPRTKDFICPNKECKVDLKDKEAIVYRPNPNEYNTQYICTNCSAVF